jgi:sodium transport system permease protein
VSRLVLAVARKETVDGLRDRRSLASALMAVLVGPMLAGAAIAMLANAEAVRPLDVLMSSPEHAPALVSFLEDRGARISRAQGDVLSAVRSGRADVALVIPDDHARTLQEGRPAEVQIVSDPSRGRSSREARRAQQLVGAYAQELARLRLLARGVSPEILTPVRIETLDLSTERSRAAAALATLPVFLLVSAFIAGMSLAIDSTAGERERGSLEPLLQNPVEPRALLLGKWLAVSGLNAFGVVLTLAVSVLVLRRLPLEDMGVRMDLGPADLTRALVVCLPLAFLAAGLQLLVATLGRSFKEGQTYVSMLLFAPMVAGMMLAFFPLKTSPWMFGVPLLSQHQLLSAVFRGDGSPPVWLGLAGGVALLAALACVQHAASRLGDEKIVLGR